MKKYITITLFTVLTATISFSQNIPEFENARNIITENFNKSESSFPILTNIDNYFIIDNGDYLLSRNNTESEYAILASTNEMISDFTLKTAIKIGPSSIKKASAGILIKAQSSGRGALVFEINRKGEFRIKELQNNNTYKYLSGKNSNEGWVKNKDIRGQDQFNSIEIRCKENTYDIYVNNKFITTLFSSSFKSGRMGIVIGKDAKARIAYYNIDVPADSENNLVNEYINDLNTENLSNRIKELESEKITLKNTKKRLVREIELLKNDNQVVKLEKKLVESNIKIDSINKIVSDLNKDLELSNNLLDEERKNLSASNTQLEKSNNMIVTLNTEKFELKSKITELDNSIKELKKSKLELQSDLESKQIRLENQIEINKDLNNTKSILQNNNDVELEKNKKLNSEITNLKNKISSSNTKLKNAENDLKNLNKKLSNTNDKLENLKQKNNNLQEKIISINNKVFDLDSEITSLKSKLEKEKSSSISVEKNLKEKISSKSKELNSLNSKISRLNNEISSLKNKYKPHEKLDNQNKKLIKSVSRKESKIDSLVIKISNLEKYVQELENKNNLLTSLDKQNSEKIDLYTSTINDLKAKVENMKSVLIYKGFSEKNIKSEDIKANKIVKNVNNSKESTFKNNIDQNNVVYSVQIATFGEKVSDEYFNGITDIFIIESGNDTYQYMSGKFKSSNNALEYKNKLISLGYIDAFVVKL